MHFEKNVQCPKRKILRTKYIVDKQNPLNCPNLCVWMLIFAVGIISILLFHVGVFGTESLWIWSILYYGWNLFIIDVMFLWGSNGMKEVTVDISEAWFFQKEKVWAVEQSYVFMSLKSQLRKTKKLHRCLTVPLLDHKKLPVVSIRLRKKKN